MLEVNRLVRYDSMTNHRRRQITADTVPPVAFAFPLDHRSPADGRPHDAPPDGNSTPRSSHRQGTQQQMTDRNARSQWIGTKELMLIILVLWLLFAMAVHLFVVPLNRIIIPYLDLPLGFFMAAQGALLAFV